MLTISLSLYLLYSTSIGSSAARGLLLEMWGYNCVLLTIPTPLYLSPLYLLIESEPAFNSPCCAPSCVLVILFHPTFLPLPFFPPLPGCLLSHILALLINNLSSFSAFCISSRSLYLASPLKRMSDSLRLRHSRGVTSPRTSFFPPLHTRYLFIIALESHLLLMSLITKILRSHLIPLVSARDR